MTVPGTRPARGKFADAVANAWGFVKGRKLLVVVVAWGVAVGVMAFVSPSITVREQTTVADSLEQLDRAIGDAAGVLSGSDYGYYLSPLSLVGECDITPVRSGERYDRTVTVHAQDTGAAVAELVDALTDEYRLELVSGPESPVRYSGHIPGYVELTLTQLPDGSVQWRADTGCRRLGDDVAALSPRFETPREIADVLAELNLEADGFRLGSAQCSGIGDRSGSARSVVATTDVPDISDVSVLAESVPDRAKVLVSDERVLAYRIGDSVTSVVLSDEDMTIATTVDCR